MAYSYIPGATNPEYVPIEICGVLSTFGWQQMGAAPDGRVFFTHYNRHGYYSWSEAVVMELSKTFIELGKS